MKQRGIVPDFDTLVALHQYDAEAFEAFRRQLLRHAIEDAPPARRAGLERLLERIESVRASAATPLDAAKASFSLMADSVHALRDAWHEAGHALAEYQTLLVIEQARQTGLLCRRK